MHDLRAMAADPVAFVSSMKGRANPEVVNEIADQFRLSRAHLRQVEEAAAAKKALSRQIAPLMKDQIANAVQIAGLKALVEEQDAIEERSRHLEEEAWAAAERLARGLPNRPADDVPEGATEADNYTDHTWGNIPAIPNAKDHVELGTPLGMDFEQTAKISGSRFVTLRGNLARFERVLGQFMLDQHVLHGWEEVSPPHIVRYAAMVGTGQFPKFEHDAFTFSEDDSIDAALIPTAEVPLTNMVRECILDPHPLQRMVALTPCYRREAGSAGRDTKGMIRLHQFNKVELVSIVEPDKSEAEHEHMLAAAEGILTILGLPFRRILLCSGDMGFSAMKTYDLEVWMPSQKAYREISSISNCGDFQARRMDARCRRPDNQKGTDFVHTLNGSGVAVGRALVAILENYQNADGSINIPGVLQDRLQAERLTKDGFC